jgi:hypothetical protein
LQKPSFQFFDGLVGIMAAKQSSHGFRMWQGHSIMQGVESDCFLETSCKLRRYRLQSKEGTEEMTCEVKSVSTPLVYHRYFVMKLTVNDQEMEIHSRMPTKTVDGRYIINFGGKFTKHSIKNAMLVDNNDRPVMIVRRIGDEDLEVENIRGLPPRFCFAFSLMSWVCPY